MNMWHIMANVQMSYKLSEQLIRSIYNRSSLIRCRDDSIDRLVDAGADVNKEWGLMLPLHTACMLKDQHAVTCLIDRGAQVNLLDGHGRAALHYAAENSVGCLRILLNAGAEPNLPDVNMNTALHWAAYRNQDQAVKELLNSGADVNATDCNDSTPLIWAAKKGSLQAIRVLLDYNASIDIVDANRDTALSRTLIFQATGLNTPEDDAIFQLLVEATGRCKLKDVNNWLSERIASDNRLSDLLVELCSNTQSLQSLCRHKIRYRLGQQFLPHVVQKLHLPPKLKKFILLQT